MKYGITFFALIIGLCVQAYAADEKQDAKGLDMVSDTVSTVFNKANALLSGNLEVTMSKDKADTSGQYTTNAIGQRVPKATAVKSAGSLHGDDPL